MNFCEIFGTDIYVVGGAVRDEFLGLTVSDIDIASALLPLEFKKLCIELGFKTFDTGIDHGTVTVLIHGQPYEHTTFRKDVSCDGRNASISFSKTIEEDLSRRDFTINAIAKLGDQIIDPFGGKKDLDLRILRTVGNAEERFSEDYLRIIRAARFASRLDMTIDPDLMAAAQKLSEKVTSHVSVERISDEFKKAQAHARPFMQYLKKMGISPYLFPKAEALGLNENWWDEVHRASQFDTETYFASLVRPLGNKEDVEEACRKYKLSRSIIRFSTQLVSHLDYLSSENFTLKQTYHMIKHCGDNSVKILNYAEKVLLIKSHTLEESLRSFQKITDAIKSPLINGGDLQKIGVTPGPGFRDILDNALLQQVKGQNRDSILNQIQVT